MKERLRRFGKVIGFAAFFLLMLSIFVAVTFPYDAVRTKIVGAFNAQQKPGAAQQELQIDELGGYFITGVRASGVKLLSASSDASTPPAEISIDQARARLQLLPLLILRKVIKFDLEMSDGSANGKVSENGDTRSIELEFDGVDVGQIGPVSQTIGLPIQGKLYGTLSLELPGMRAAKANGNVALELRELTVGDGKAKLKIPGMSDGLTIQKINVGTLTIEGECKDGLLKLTKMSSNGPDLVVDGEGTVKLNDLANESLVNVTLGLKVSEAYKNKSDANKGLFIMLDVAPDAKQAKRADGSYGIRLAGPLGRLKPGPAIGGPAAGMPSAGGLGGAKSKRGLPKNGLPGGAALPGADAPPKEEP